MDDTAATNEGLARIQRGIAFAVAAELAGAPDAERAARVYREDEWRRVTPTVLSMGDGAPVEVSSAPDR